MAKVSTNDFQPGMTIIYKDAIHTIVERHHHKPGKGSAVMRTKLRNIKTGSVISETFQSGESFEEASLEERKMQYLYKDENAYYFMDPETFEQTELPAVIAKPFTGYMKDGEDYELLLDESGTPVTMRFPKKVVLEVKEAPEAVKGDTATNTLKEIILETGMKIKAPLFIKPGDKIAVNTEDGSYVERVNEK